MTETENVTEIGNAAEIVTVNAIGLGSVTEIVTGTAIVNARKNGGNTEVGHAKKTVTATVTGERYRLLRDETTLTVLHRCNFVFFSMIAQFVVGVTYL